MSSVTDTPAWQKLAAHHDKIKDVHLRDLFAEDGDRAEKFTAEGAGLTLDYSKQRITDSVAVRPGRSVEPTSVRDAIPCILGGAIVSIAGRHGDNRKDKKNHCQKSKKPPHLNLLPCMYW